MLADKKHSYGTNGPTLSPKGYKLTKFEQIIIEQFNIKRKLLQQTMRKTKQSGHITAFLITDNLTERKDDDKNSRWKK